MTTPRPPAPRLSLADLRARYVEGGRALPADIEAALVADGRAGARAILAAVARRRRANRAEGQRLRKMLRFETALWASGVTHVAGVDEAGVSPLASLEIGFSRTAQWGGRGRPESLDSFVRMLAGEGINVEDDTQTQDVANELSGVDLRLRCPLGVPCALYGQFIGEDEANHLPARFMGLYGLESWSADGRHRWFAELVETTCGAVLAQNPVRPCAYRNHAYPEGYAHAGRWLGSAAGADSRLLTVGWLDVAGATSLRVHAGNIGARVGVFEDFADPAHAGRLRGLTARQAWRWGRVTLGAELDWFVVDTLQGTLEQARLGMTVRIPF